MKREIELDFVRGIAILLVLDYHSMRQTLFYPFKLLGFAHFGWAGVDIFFVLSGFLVGGLLIKEWKVRGRIDSKQFLIRRGFKIWPQYYVFLFAMLLTHHRTLKQLWGNLLNIQNYVGGGVAHTWSLAVEEHAYLFLVLCLAIAARRQTRMRNLFLFLVASTALVISLQLFLSWKGYNTFAWTHTRIDGIFCGVMIAIVYHYRPELFQKLQKLWWIWAAAVLSALLYLRFANTYTALMAAIGWDFANLMGIGLLMLLYRHRPGVRRPAIYRLIAWIGLYSYGIYLWHVSVMYPVMQGAHYLPAWFVPWWLALGPLVFGVLIGVVFTKAVEFPALRLRDRLFPRRVDSAVGTPAEVEEKMVAGQIT